MNTRATLELDSGAIPSSVRLNVSAGTAFCGSCAALLPDVVADAVQVKAKKIEMIIVASIVFFMLENLLFSQQTRMSGTCIWLIFRAFVVFSGNSALVANCVYKRNFQGHTIKIEIKSIH